MPVSKESLVEGMTLTEMLHAEIKRDNKKWNKDHVKAFFKSRLQKPLNDESANGLLHRVSKLPGMTTHKINGRNHCYTAISQETKKALHKFLYGKE